MHVGLGSYSCQIEVLYQTVKGAFQGLKAVGLLRLEFGLPAGRYGPF